MDRSDRLADLLLVGHFASGKSTVAVLLANGFNCPVVEVGDIVRSNAKAVGQSAFRHAEHVLSSPNPLKFAYEAVGKIRSIPGPVVIVGIRTPDELSLLRNLRPSVVIALDASPAARLTRWQERQADGSRLPEVPWGERDKIERGWGLDEVIRSADAVVDANRPLEAVVDAVESAWRSLSRDRV